MPRISTLAALASLLALGAACGPDSPGASPTAPAAHRTTPGFLSGKKPAPQAPGGGTAATVLSVYIDGPQNIPRNTTCGWIAFASGGTQPYTYSWTRTGAGSGAPVADYIWEGYIPYGPSLMTLSVTVTDAVSDQVTYSLPITSTPTAPMC